MLRPMDTSCLVPKRSRHWSGSGGPSKLRRSVVHLFCRLPLLVVWSLLVIYILYRATSQHEEAHSELPSSQQLSIQEQEVVEAGNELDERVVNPKQPKHKPSIKPRLDDSTRKPSSDYVRRGKVFILIVEDSLRPVQHFSPFLKLGSPVSKTRARPLARPPIPQHIRLLMDILDSHRIEYTIDTAGHSGLPELLLNDQNANSDTRQYPVIVIDNFIKYTKLNRWVRDQLDRHCRSNSIGVITYLQPNSLDLAEPVKPTIFSRATSSTGSTSTTDHSLADQFPLNFKPIIATRKEGKKTLCDLQLNEQAPMLRILKRKPNFIISGPLGSNVDQLPWVSMWSNHITYEPVTWAQLRPQQDAPEPATYHLSTSGRGSLVESMVNASAVTDKRDQVANRVAELDSSSELQILSLDQQQQPLEPLPSRHQHSVHHAIDNNTQTVPMQSESNTHELSSLEINSAEPQILSMYDRGLYDGIKRVIFGGANHNWLNRILLLDSIEHLSSGRIISPLDRYIQIDIDDIFVAETGKRMNKSDVFALISMQREFSNRIEGGFKFNLGYSGKYYKQGSVHENLGDEELVARADEFTWFCHTWSHSKAHLFTDIESQVRELRRNAEFGHKHKLPIIGHLLDRNQESDPQATKPTYAVAPHHSGVYPIHEPLYDAWREVLNVQVTSTEEYPALRPANKRRAFVHKTIKVLPRQTCGLYTHTIYRDKYPGGPERLDASIRGGELFETVLHNPVNIYMSHMSNYANDRLALYTFKGLLDFVQENTHLQLRYAPTDRNQLGPKALADYYFSLYPTEQGEPLWTNPCNDHRHLAIWAPSKRPLCKFVPQLLIVGPQKTGTTALYTFLKMNTVFQSSGKSSTEFEEVQFFDEKHYGKGSDWYFSRFRPDGVAGLVNHRRNGSAGTIYFDKSATYFDDPQAPARASSLLPEASIIVMLVDPVDRAYSWYQHMKAHSDPAALAFSFEQVIMASEGELRAGSGSTSQLRQLRSRCLQPGYYSQHIARWLEHYPARQIIIIDGLWFRHNPGAVMNRLQLLLRAPKQLDYRELLALDHRKGFYCMRADADPGGPASTDSHVDHHHQQNNDHDQHHDDNHKRRQQRSREGANHHQGPNRPRLKCLGPSKGRRYAPMSKEARQFLNRHYWAHNRQLARILSEIGQPLPGWLDEAMGIT